ncbi:MAG: NAD(P)/FAD-dependent oxidoreductase [Rhodospirillales bacterium]|jgi:predicted Rossmann fold flavoprotein|nr:NAD(P)/FAD-dependent oxidoreductase [Rhodospirillales bacterium]
MGRNRFDVVIVGAGAAGLMCAARAGQRGRRVLLLDHADEPGKKILISGGGRCNFTNLRSAPECFLSGNLHFCKSALARYTQHDFIALVEKHRIAYHEKTLGQLFCDGSARQIVAMLLDECAAAGVDLRLNHRIGAIKRADDFSVETDRGNFTAGAIVVATGGLSIPKMGASGFAHTVARHFGLSVTETRPALTPLTFGDDDLAMMRTLSGVALDAHVRCGGGNFREAVLFTHRGLSGPAILQASSYWRAGAEITVDLLPGTDAATYLLERKRSRPKAAAKTVLAEILPQRLAQSLAETHLPAKPLGEMSDKVLSRLAALLNGWNLTPKGSEGYAKAEVTLGGVDTRGLSSKTMAAMAVPGLYFIGEAVDVTGWLGGYNFQWAWSSGWAAGEAV